MKVVVAIDSFKGSLSSIEAGEAAKRGIKMTGQHEVVVKPLADGGEGTTEALITGLGGKFISVLVKGPLGDKVIARYGILSDEKTAVIEMAEASGITLVKKDELNPWYATTYGLGEMILDAINRGCTEFIIGIGGSATTDVGLGMLMALGYRFFDDKGNQLSYDFESLDKVARIDAGMVEQRIKKCKFKIACDVTNPLYGENGSVFVFGTQKGVAEAEKSTMDNMVKHFAKISDAHFKTKYDMAEGAGAAGGLGFAFMTFFDNAELESGIDIILEAIDIEKDIVNADIIVTGEGRLDGQTAMGKVPVGVATMAKKYGCKVIAVAGQVTDDAILCNEKGIDAFFSIVRGAMSLEEAMDKKNAEDNMEKTVEQIFRLLDI